MSEKWMKEIKDTYDNNCHLYPECISCPLDSIEELRGKYNCIDIHNIAKSI